jgi:HK97 family phage major capsid protein
MNTQLKLKEARENHGAKLAELRTLLDNGKPMTEINEQVTALENEIASTKAEVSRYERMVQLDAENAAIPAVLSTGEGDMNEVKKNFRFIDILQAGNADNAQGFLKEMHSEGLKELSQRGLAAGHGVVIPTIALRSEARSTQVVGTDNVGGYLRETSVDGGIIEFLGNKLVLASMGVQTFDNLIGNVNMPTGTTGLTTAWETEVSSADETNETFGVVSYSPNRLAGFTNISKQLIRQGNASISAYLANEAKKAIARAWQAAALHGNSAGIDGIAGTSGIGSVAGGTHGAAPTWTNIVNLYKELAVDNADDGSLYYLTNANVVGKLQTTSKQSSGVEGNFIINDPTMPLNGLGLKITNSVSSTLTKGTTSSSCSAIFCGNFADLGLASWGGIEVFFDPYTGAKTGYDVMHINAYVDANVHRAVSFAAMLDAITT